MVLSMREESKTRNSAAAAGAEAPDGAFWLSTGVANMMAVRRTAVKNRERQGETEKRNMRKLYQIGRPSGRSPPCLASDYNEKTDKIPRRRKYPWRNAPSASSSRTRSARVLPEPFWPRSKRPVFRL